MHLSKTLLVFLFLSVNFYCFAQENKQISTMDFVQVVDKNTKEAIFYYENNWKVLREMALEKDYIASFQLLETTPTESEPFQFILITTYKDKEQYELREAHFSELIQERAELKLLNEKKPGEFRKTLFSREMVIHLE